MNRFVKRMNIMAWFLVISLLADLAKKIIFKKTKAHKSNYTQIDGQTIQTLLSFSTRYLVILLNLLHLFFYNEWHFDMNELYLIFIRHPK